MAEVRDDRFHYTGSGLSNVWLRNGFEVHYTPYGEGVAIHDVEGLHRAIGLFLANHRERLSGEEVRFLRKEMDLPQAQLAKLLEVSTDTVREWESGRGRIGGPADKLLRLIYTEMVTDEPATHIRERLERIAQLNRQVYAETLEFEETERGWEAAEAA